MPSVALEVVMARHIICNVLINMVNFGSNDSFHI